MKYSTLLLDLDHTLLDSDTSEIEAFAHALSNQGVKDPLTYFDTYRRINAGLWAEVERGDSLPGDVRVKRFELLIDAVHITADAEVMADDYVVGFATYGDLYPGARDVLDELAESVSLALITNGLSEVQRPRIDRLGLERYFDAIVISAEVGATKPGQRIFDIAFGKLGYPPKDSVLMVGDSLSSDIRGGADYGIDTCWFNRNGKTAGPDDRVTYEIKTHEELLALAAL